MSKLHHQLVRGMLAAFSFGLIASSLHAGDITGRVSDPNTGKYIVAASVTISETGRSTSTDREGRFTLSGIPEGNATLEVDSIGYDGKSQMVSVPATGAIQVNVSMGSDVIQLGALTVEGIREGRSKALQQKRTAVNFKDIISADSVGNLPDRNVAEALSRVAGIALSMSGGEGRFVSIRGIEPNLNNVTFNGTTIAPPGVDGRTGRATGLDIIAASQISQIEVIKSVTPDMDGNALGGTINIKTVSAYDRENRFIYGGVSGGSNDGRNEDQAYDIDFTFGNTFGKDRTVGLALAASYSNRPYQNDNVQGDWAKDDTTGYYYPTKFEYHPEVGNRKRLGLNLNLEIRPDDDSQYYLRGIYNKYKKNYVRDEILTQMRRDPVFVSPTVVTVNRERYEIRQFKKDSTQTLVNLTPGMSKKIGDFKVDAEVTYSYSKELQNPNNSVEFRTGNVNVPQLATMDFSQFNIQFFDNGSMTAASTDYPLRRFKLEDSLVKETTVTPQVDVTREFHNMFNGRSGFFKVGAKFYHRHRLVDDNSSRPSDRSFSLDDLGARGPALSFFGGKYTAPITVNFDAAFNYLASNPNDFNIDEAESASNSAEDDFDITEKITAVYAMLSVDVSSQLTAMVGLRYEGTDATIDAKQARTVDGNFVGIFPQQGSTKYDTLMPNFQLRYEASKQSIVRFAYNRTLGRPAYQDAAPISTLEIDRLSGPLDPAFPFVGEYEVGNPKLEPFISDNLDLGIEYYLKSGGILSAGYFYKNIKNPIYRFGETLKNQSINGFGIETLDLSETRNADTGKISGLELSAQIPFSSFLDAGMLDGFGVDFNATFIGSSVTVPGRSADTLPFFQQPDRIYNGSIYYQKGRITARAAYNYQTESLTELRGDTQSDYYHSDRYFIDLQGSFKVTENLSAFANWKNITNQQDETYTGQNSRMRQSYDYGSDVRAGVRYNF